LIFLVWDHSIDTDFIDADLSQCYANDHCQVPLNNNGAAYLLVRYILLMLPTEVMWYVFYYIPKKFNARMIHTNTIEILTTNECNDIFPSDELSLIDALKYNMASPIY
jgi:hypothetical protein